MTRDEEVTPQPEADPDALELEKETLEDLQSTERADVRGGACRQGASQPYTKDCGT